MALAAAFEGAVNLAGKTAVLTMSGGNVDRQVARCLREGAAWNRRINFAEGLFRPIGEV